MSINRRQQSSILFGDELHKECPTFPATSSCYFHGVSTNNKRASVPLSEEILSKHILFLGGIGTGKTNAFCQVIAQLNQALTDKDVMIIFDTKGDFYREFYRPGDVVISNDGTSTGKFVLDYWNIFNEIDRGERLNESVIEVSKALFAEACEKTNQIFFPNAARDIFMACILHFVRKIPLVQQTNENLVKYIHSSTSADIREMLLSYEDLRAMSSYISNDDSPQTQGVMSELQQVVREVFIGNFAKAGTLSLKNLVKDKGAVRVFIEYDLSIGKMLSPVYSLMFDMAIKEALGRQRSEGNVYFITDEFKLLPHLSHIDDAVNFGRSLGIKLMIGVQNVEQLYDNYGEERARSILSGFLTNVCFRVNDAVSREYIQGLFAQIKEQANDIVEQAVFVEGYASKIRWSVSEAKYLGYFKGNWQDQMDKYVFVAHEVELVNPDAEAPITMYSTLRFEWSSADADGQEGYTPSYDTANFHTSLAQWLDDYSDNDDLFFSSLSYGELYELFGWNLYVDEPKDLTQDALRLLVDDCTIRGDLEDADISVFSILLSTSTDIYSGLRNCVLIYLQRDNTNAETGEVTSFYYPFIYENVLVTTDEEGKLAIIADSFTEHDYLMNILDSEVELPTNGSIYPIEYE